jgi:hypothetical protein
MNALIELTRIRVNKAPFPWFGGKSKAAPLVWELLGDVDHYVEPFAGALGVLLERPHPCNRTYFSETVNDLDGLLVNAWRAIQWHPEETAAAASWPVSEADKQARQIAVLKWRDEKVLDLLAGSAEWCDPKMAGWWLYGVCCQIGAIAGPWTADPVTGRIVKQGNGVARNRPHLSDDGQGVNHAQLREPGTGEDPEFHPLVMPDLTRWFRWLSARLRHVRIVNGDWSRVVTTGAAHTLPVRQGGYAGIFVDPPYSQDVRAGGLYAHEASATLLDDVRAWAIKAGEDPKNRIVLAGFDVEHVELEAHGWQAHEWFAPGFLTGGYGNIDVDGDGHQQERERLWASPHCMALAKSQQFALFEDVA